MLLCEDLALWFPVLEFTLGPLLTLRALLLPPPATPHPSPPQFQPQSLVWAPIIYMSEMRPDAAADQGPVESQCLATG